MSGARTDYPYKYHGGYRLWSTMCDHIDSLEAEVARLENDIDEHGATHYCRFMPGYEA